MHEGKFTEQIVQAILEALTKEKVDNPKKVHVRVGEIYHLEPESVKMHYQLQTQETALKNSELVLKEEPVSVECKKCGQTGEVEDHHMPMCRFCDSMDVTVVSGNDVLIESIEVE